MLVYAATEPELGPVSLSSILYHDYGHTTIVIDLVAVSAS